MASTNYSEWEKFNPDVALGEIDEREKIEDIEKEKQKAESSELKTLEEISFATAALKSKAAVEALKAKGRVRRRRRQNHQQQEDEAKALNHAQESSSLPQRNNVP
eukprot:CAMPEP_0206412866 /NCGR_PEP_ID=MMETSP0294-20121207/34304_1 /ASSEMBLY_ACC=CAM_ASM_000327 /TAXON_ID=39354 /ORGANISM="Heterosigma akashiwo, Strain CCMP2393" /LENGTH=104 /DNA_ID=CAMNT_0053874207 /DNA_START=79 /DNA_END=389 /DNA_ORIENTATION=+